MSKKILLATGGSGGHVYPALALAQQLQQVDPGVEIKFAGGGLSRNRFFRQQDYSYLDVPCGAVGGRGWLRAFQDVGKILSGIWRCTQLMRSFQPDLVVGFGSYHSLPVLAAARLCRVPLVLHEGNAVPGKVIRHFSPYSRATAVYFPDAAKLLKGRSIPSDFPLREGYTQTFGSQTQARRHFGLADDRFTFLIFGGSQGAVSLNTLASQALLGHLASRTKQFQVIHMTGSEESAEELRALYRKNEIPAFVSPFLSEMDLGWKAADLAISRAGASSIAEQMEFEVPAILIPYPFAADHHQDKNADYVVHKVGGGVKLREPGLQPERLAREISALVANEREKLGEMEANLRSFKARNQPRDLCSLVCEVGGLKLR